MKKTLSVLLSAMMIFSSFQYIVHAEDEEQPDQKDTLEITDEKTADKEKTSENEKDSDTNQTEISETEPTEKEEKGRNKENSDPVTAESAAEKEIPAETPKKAEKKSASDSKCGDNLTWEFSNNTLTISGTGDMYDYSEDNLPPWIEFCTNIETIKINDGVTSVGNFAFSEPFDPEIYDPDDDHETPYTSIQTIILADSVKKIGIGAFFYMFTDYEKQYLLFTLPKGLEYVDCFAFCGNYCLPFSTSRLPENLEYIGDRAFYNCNGLLGILVLPEGLIEIGEYAFSECYYISEIQFPLTLEVIWNDCFSFLEELKEIRISNNIRKLEEYTFYNCNLQDVIIGKNVSRIEDSVFMKNDNLKTVTFLGNVPHLDTWAFGKCYDVTVYYPADNPTWTEEAKKVVEKQFASVTWKVITRATRIYGTGRYQTSVQIADEMKLRMGVDKFDNVILASGGGFADALSGSYLSYVKKAPIILTAPNVSGDINTYINNNLKEGGTVYVLGGEASVPESCLSGLNVDPEHIIRLKGKDRYKTSIEILKACDITDEEIIIASGATFPDSLSASAAKKPILLVNGGASELNEAQREYLGSLSRRKYYIVGGEKAVSEGIQAEVSNKYDVSHEAKRVKGPNRYETSIAVAEEFVPDSSALVVAYSDNYPDGLCGGALAMLYNAPVILTKAGSEGVAVEYAESHGITEGYVLGGAGFITDEMVKSIFDLRSTKDIIRNRRENIN